MKLSTFLTISAVIALAFGFAFVAAPARMLTQYGMVPYSASVIMSRFFGATLFTLGLLVFLARSVSDPIARRAIVFGSLVGDALGLAVAIHAQRSGFINALGWSSVAIYALLTLGFAYFAFGERTAK